MPASFGATLRLLRIDSGLSLRSLAQRIGVSSAYLSRVENGLDPVPTPDRLVEIARSLRLPPTLLLDLAHRTGSFVARYLEDVPAAGALFLEIARRRLTPMQIARLKALVETEFGGQSADTGTVSLASLLAPERIILSLSCSELDDVIDVAAPRLLPVARLSARELAESIRHRERAASTALGGGLAVPHALLAEVPPRAAVPKRSPHCFSPTMTVKTTASTPAMMRARRGPQTSSWRSNAIIAEAWPPSVWQVSQA